MKDQNKTIIAAAIGVACAGGIILAIHRPSAKPDVVSSQADTTAPQSNVVEQSAPIARLPSVPEPSSAPLMAQANRPDARQSAEVTPQPSPTDPEPNQEPPAAPKAGRKSKTQAAQSSPDNSLAAPDARVALSFVGTDPQAEAVWLDAINDPTVPPDERKDLIEDLNEDGFPDPHNITDDDIPLVMSRIALIEQVGPIAMDDVNAAAFNEAYKDLTNMLADRNPK